MLEYFVVYDRATGEERWRGSGTAGAAALQTLPEELAALIVPQAALVGARVDLDIVKQAMIDKINAEGEQFCCRFVSPGSTKAMRYLRKEAEARAWSEGADMAAFPFLAKEAAKTGSTVAALVATIIARADQWQELSSSIEAEQQAAYAAIAAATTISALVAAATVDWEAISA